MFEKEQPDNGNFAGFPSYDGSRYKYNDAKNTLKEALLELRTNEQLVTQLKMNPNTKGRKHITGKKETVVWDFLSMDNEGEKKALHLTLGINNKNVEATITIPRSINKYQEDIIKELGEDGFIELCKKILERMQPILNENSRAQPILRGLQRRYPDGQKAYPTMDTIIEADLRTAFENDADIKKQTQWLEVIYDVFCNQHRDTNYQVQIGIYFSYKKCPNLQKENATDLIVKSWLACKPLIDACK